MSALDKIDSIAQVKKPAKSASSVPEYTPTEQEQKILDKYIATKLLLKEQTAIVANFEGELRSIGKNFLDEAAENHNFTKSVKISGTEGSVRITQTDRFSIKDENAESSLKELLGEEYDNYFTSKRTVSLKAEVLANDGLLEELLKKFPENEFVKFFEVKKVISTKKGFDESRYNLSKAKRKSIEQYVAIAEPGITIL